MKKIRKIRILDLCHRQGAAYIKELFVIFTEEREGGRARVAIDEERVL